MSSFQSDFKTIGSKLMRTQHLASTPTTTDSEESTVLRQIDYAGDSNGIRTPLGEGQKFEIMVDAVILADRALKAVRSTYNKCIGVKLQWRFLGKDASSRIVQVKENEIPIGESFTYNIPIDSTSSTFFNDRVIHFDVYAIYANKEKLVGFSELQLSDCTENLNMQLGKCLDLLYITKQKCCTRSKTKNIGRLLIQYKLYSQTLQNKASTLRQIIETIQKYPKSSPSSTRGKTIESSSVSSKDSTYTLKLKNTPSLFEKIIKKVSEGVLASSSQQRINQIINDQEYLLDFFEGDFTSQEKQSNLNENPASLPNLTSSKFAQLHNAAITIIINSVKFNESFGKKLKPTMTYYVEYSFLTKEGLETLNFPLSSDFSATYDAMTTFKFDMRKNVREYKMISKMITSNKSLRFCVIEEPIVDGPKVPICVELGYSDVNVRDLVHGKNNNTEYPLLSMQYPHELIGFLNVDIIGLENIVEILQRRPAFGIIFDKAKSLGSIEDKPDGEKVEMEAQKKLKQQNHESPMVVLNDYEEVSSKLKNVLQNRSSSLCVKSPIKIPKEDVTTKVCTKSMSSRRKKIERAMLNRRFTSLISDNVLPTNNVSDNLVENNSRRKAIRNEVVEKSEIEDTKEKTENIENSTFKE